VVVGIGRARNVTYRKSGRSAMAKKDAYLTGNDNAAAQSEQGGRSENSFRPKPEEGLRLMHAFFDIRQHEVRDALINFVAELSRLQKNE
jgi:hypothetical protein